MTDLILPGGNGVNPAVETANAEIGGQEVEYLVQPGRGIGITVSPGQEMFALQACAQMISQYSILINALVREAIKQQETVAEIEAEATRDKALLGVLSAKIDVLTKRVEAHAGAIDGLQTGDGS